MAEYVKVAQMSEVPPGTIKGVKAGDQEIALVSLEGQLYAIGDICPHAHCNLSDGDIEGDRVLCPCHGSEFNVRTGQVVEGPASENVATFQVRVEGDDILVAT